jgi:hypothetical protein
VTPVGGEQTKKGPELKVAAVIELGAYGSPRFVLRLSGTRGSGSGKLAAWENLMSDARKLRPEWEFVVAVVAAVILAAPGGATIFSLMHRPVAAPRPPMAEPVAAPTLAAPEVSRPLRANTPVAAQQPTEPKEIKSPGETPHIPRWGVWLAADVSESMAWTLYHESARQFASLIGDRKPVVLFRPLSGLGNAKRYVIAIVDDDRAHSINSARSALRWVAPAT